MVFATSVEREGAPGKDLDCLASLATTRRKYGTFVARMSGAICGTARGISGMWSASSRMSLRSCGLPAKRRSHRQRDRILHLAQRETRFDRRDAVEPRQLVLQKRLI